MSHEDKSRTTNAYLISGLFIETSRGLAPLLRRYMRTHKREREEEEEEDIRRDDACAEEMSRFDVSSDCATAVAKCPIISADSARERPGF